jgi:hypothetical protein
MRKPIGIVSNESRPQALTAKAGRPKESQMSKKVNGKAKPKSKELVAREKKEAESVARFLASDPEGVQAEGKPKAKGTANGKPKAAPEVKVKTPCDRSAAAKKAWATSREKIIAGIRKAMAAKKAK